MKLTNQEIQQAIEILENFSRIHAQVESLNQLLKQVEEERKKNADLIESLRNQEEKFYENLSKKYGLSLEDVKQQIFKLMLKLKFK